MIEVKLPSLKAGLPGNTPTQEQIEFLWSFAGNQFAAGCSKMLRCKAPEILKNEAYSCVRRNDEG